MGGPLSGLRVIEVAGLGALPFGVVMLADMGADVIRVERTTDVPDDPIPAPRRSWDRGRRSVALDLKNPDGVTALLRLTKSADVLCEAFRPGVAERLGFGPDEALARNPALVYGRLTGWGRSGPLAQSVGHSLNYEALTGVIAGTGPRGGPSVPPLTLLGDFAGGGMLLAFGVVCAVLEARESGRGQVVDAAMVDGVASLGRVFHLMDDLDMLGETGTNMFDGGAPFYNVYRCADGCDVAVAAVEAHFYVALLEGLGLADAELPDQSDESGWPAVRERFATAFATRTRDEWCEHFAGLDACVSPVLTWSEAREHPHNVERAVFGTGGAVHSAPRLSRTPGEPRDGAAWPGADTDGVLSDAGFSTEEIAALRRDGAVR